MNLGSLNVKIGADTSGLTAALSSAKQQAEQFAVSLRNESAAMATATRAMAESSAVTTSNAERTRQLNAASRELAVSRARLAEIIGGESKIAQDTAAKYYALSNTQRAQIVEVKEGILALEMEAKAQQAAAATAVRAQEQKIAAAGRAALAQRAAAESAIQAAEAEAAAEVKAALAAGQAAGAQAAAAARAQAGAGIGGALSGMGGLLAAGAVAGALHEAVKASIDFNREMANVGSLIPGNVQRLAELKGAVQQLAIETGKDTKDIATGAYQIISSFGDSADTAKLLAINTRLAIGGVADVGKTIGLTAAVTKTFGDHSAEAVQHVADLAAMTVRLGHTTLPELNASIGQVAPIASQLGVSLNELFGTLATGSGVTGNMSRVSTQLRGILASFANPTKAMVELFNSVGVSSGKALIEQRGFAGAVQLVVDTAEKTDTPLQKYFHRIEATTLALPLAGAQAKNLGEKIDAMAHSAGAAEKAFQAQQTGAAALGTEWKKLGEVAKVTGQTLGDALAPALTYLLTQTNTYIQRVGHLRVKLAEIGKDIAGIAGGKQDWGLSGPGPMGEPKYQALIDQARSGYLGGLGAMAPGSAGTAPPAARPATPAPTKAQLDAHQRVLDDIGAARLAAQKQQAVEQYGEPSRQVAALELYSKAWNTLTAAQKASTVQLYEAEKAQDASQQRVKAHTDALDAQAKAEQSAADKRRKAAEDAEKLRKSREADYHSFLKQQQLETQANIKTPNTPMKQLQEDHPGWSKTQYEKALAAQQWNQFTRAGAESSRAAEEAENAANAAMKSQLQQQKLDADSALAKRKYGEVNRESLALDSQWNAHYKDLAPNQKRIIDQIYEITKAEELRAAAAQIDQQSWQTLSERYAEATKRQAVLSGTSRELTDTTAAFAAQVDLLNPEMMAYALAIADMDQGNEQLARSMAAAEKEFETWAGQMQTATDAQQAQQNELKKLTGQWTDLDELMAKLGLSYQDTSDDVMLMVLALNDQEKAMKKVAEGQKFLEQFADGTRDVFENAFHDAYEHGPKAFFASVIHGVEQMFQDIAAKYLASQLTDLIFGKPNANGDRSTSSGGGGILNGLFGGGGLQDVIGLVTGGVGGGSSIPASSLQNMFGLASVSRGGDTYTPPSGGSATIQGAQRGTVVHQTVNIHAVDANSFRQNKGAVTADLYRASRKAFQRDG